MADLASYFSNLKKYSEDNSSKKTFVAGDDTGKVLNLTKQSNQGTVLLRPIMDNNGIPMKVLTKIHELYETNPRVDAEGKPVLNEDGTQQYSFSTIIVPDPSNYAAAGVTLTPDQTMVLNNCINTIKKYEDYVENGLIDPDETATGLGVKYRKEISIFWAKVLSLTANNQTSLTEGKVRLIRHNSANFATQFADAIDGGTAIRRDGGAWIQDYFSRNPGQSTKVTSITTELNKGGTVGYSMSFMFADGAAYELTQDDINVCTSLHSQLLDLTNFDASIYNAVTNRINGYIIAADRKMANDTGAQVAEQPTYTTIDTTQVVSTPVTDASTPANSVTTTTLNPANISLNVATIPTPGAEVATGTIGTPNVSVGTIPNVGTPVNSVAGTIPVTNVQTTPVNPVMPNAAPSFNTMTPAGSVTPNPDPIGQMPLPPGVNL